jgi:hypothetical protein
MAKYDEVIGILHDVVRVLEFPGTAVAWSHYKSVGQVA